MHPPPGLGPPATSNPQGSDKKRNALDIVAKLNQRFASSDQDGSRKRRDRDSDRDRDRDGTRDRERDYDDRKRSRRDRSDRNRRDRSRHQRNEEGDRHQRKEEGDRHQRKEEGDRHQRKEKSDRHQRKEESDRFNPAKDSSSFERFKPEKEERFKPPARTRQKSPQRAPGQPPADWPGPALTRDAKPSNPDVSRPDFTQDRPPPSVGRMPPNAGLSNKLWIDGLKRGSNETIKVNFALREMFGKHGTIENVDIKITTTSRLKGNAVITMGTAEGATQAAKFLHQSDFLDHGKLSVDIVDPNKDYSKKRGGRGRRGGGRGGYRGRGGGRGGGYGGGRDRGRGYGGGRDNYRGGGRRY